ncbi:hypothetical protein FRC04_006456 [Tulasnella sp. 424]|nr:hypothetical protein FRC04_006456 [Tulasnella sp. 424]KAG8980501.1 hypothetical protein FRC05_006134 [Tulasnella sp. 425]
MFSMRALKAFAKAPLIPPPTPVIVPMQTFRSYGTGRAEEQSTNDPDRHRSREKATSKNEQSSAGAPSTDDIAHSDAAYGGSGANPEESAEGIEREKSQPGGMKSTPANPKVSNPPTGRNGKTN